MELRHRDACHSAAALKSQISVRSAQIVQASLHGYTTSHPDRLLHEVDVQHSAPNLYTLQGKFEADHLNSRRGKFSCKGHLLSGRTFDAHSNELCLLVCSHEQEILKILESSDSLDDVHIVKPLGVYFHDGVPFSMTNHLQYNARTLLKKHDFDINVAMNLIQDIAAGLSYIHSMSFLHLSLHLSCCYFTDTKTCVIGGFELACRLEVALPFNETVQKKLNEYTDPEIMGGKCTPSMHNDVFSFGRLMYDVMQLCNFGEHGMNTYQRIVDNCIGPIPSRPKASQLKGFISNRGQLSS